MAEFVPDNFRKPTEPHVPYGGAGANKVWADEDDDKNLKRRERYRKKKDDEEQKKKDQELIRRAIKRYKEDLEAESENRSNALEDLKFKAGDQWPADIKSQRANDHRPCMTVNTVPTLTHQIENEIRENRPGINISPTGLRSSKESAEIYTGMIRAIERDSAAEIAYDTAAISAIDIGFGYFRILTEYESDRSFEQIPVIRRIRNPFTVLLDYKRQEPDGSDADHGFISELIPRDEFKDRWPEALEIPWNERSVGEELKHWITRDQMRVAEYFEVEHEMRRLLELGEGNIKWEDELDESVQEKVSSGSIEVTNWRDVEVQKVMWYRITAQEVLERQEWVGKYIPIVEVLGDEIDVEGKVYRFGVIRNAKDPVRMKNYWVTAKAEYVALQPKPPYIGPEGTFDADNNAWKVANVSSAPYLEYIPVILENGQVAPPPQKQPPPQVPQGYVEAEQSAQQDILRATGVRFDASLSERVYDESGKALHELRGLNDLGSSHFSDNLKRSLRHAGRMLVDLIPKLCKRTRMWNIVNEDGSDGLVRVDPNAPNSVGRVQRGPTEEPLRVFNPNLGEYEVTVTIGPSYATRRIEAQEQITKLAGSIPLPEVARVLAPLIAKYSDWPGAQEAYKMLLATLPPQVQSVEQKNLPPQVQAMLQGLQQQIVQLTNERQQMIQALTDKTADRQLKLEEIKVKQNKIDQDFEARLLEMLRKAEVETKRMSLELRQLVNDQLEKLFERTDTIENTLRGAQQDSRLLQEILKMADETMSSVERQTT